MFYRPSAFLAVLSQVSVFSFLQTSALASSETPWVKVKCSINALTVLDGLYMPLENEINELSLIVNDAPQFYPDTVLGSVNLKFSSTSHARVYLDNLATGVTFNDIPFYLNKDESYDSRSDFASMWEILRLGTENLRTDSKIFTLTGSTVQPIDNLGLITREIVVESLLHSVDAKANAIFVKLNAFEGNDAIRHISFDIRRCEVGSGN